ncbi:N-terminal domain of NEFA-interacting nuclear protein NIP30-domain-containing protein [Delphinella strobiligena]|nr:N-terminal domain of NEFA-interacting nuclear protein NIP30-domain-containing protein [Delphinella strobiligena]
MSRFVSGGTSDQPIERDEEWLKAQQEIEAKRRQKEEEGRQKDGKSLYETLQANKAAKQDAFEESIRLSNQFRSLDEDEVEFLDSVLESTRAKESAVKKETAEQLELFRRQQEETAKAARLAEGHDEPAQESNTWAVKKRKRTREKDNLPGVKLRKSSSSAQPPLQDSPRDPAPTPKTDEPEASELPSAAIEKAATQVSKSPTPTIEKAPPVATALGLGAYSSDED